MPLFTSALILVCLSAGTSAQAPTTRVFETGRLIENVPSASAPGQRFTLYLPTGFDPERPTPIIYLMDPRGRARVPANVFREAAERYGYILVSSHGMATDGPMEPNLHAVQAMWDDSQQWFTIDSRRTYLAGFSGTARMASLLAEHRPESFTGFIGVGAGFHPGVMPSAHTRFLYFGAIGDVDYNFHEVETLGHALAELDLPHRLERFAGPHSWLPPWLAMRAVEWLELRAMQSGARPPDAGLLDAWWERDDASAREGIGAGRLLDGARQYAAMARDFEGLRETAHVRAAAARIAGSPVARAQLKGRQAETARSNFWVDDGMEAIADAFPEGSVEPAVSAHDLSAALGLARMKRTAEGGKTEAALEARRRLNQLEVQLGFYLPHEAIAQSEYARADYYLSLAIQIDDASPVTWYMRAQTYGRLQALRQALAALRRAVEVGFRDLALVEADHSFRELHADPGYVALVATLASTGDALDWLTVDRPPVFVLR